MTGGERLIADSRAFGLGMEEERKQILAILKCRLDVCYRFESRFTSSEVMELRNLIDLLEERNRNLKGS
jgi:hypothetical protein